MFTKQKNAQIQMYKSNKNTVIRHKLWHRRDQREKEREKVNQMNKH